MFNRRAIQDLQERVKTLEQDTQVRVPKYYSDGQRVLEWDILRGRTVPAHEEIRIVEALEAVCEQLGVTLELVVTPSKRELTLYEVEEE